MYPNQFSSGSSGSGGSGSPFRAADFSLPAFTPWGSGGFAAKYVALASFLALFALAFALGVTSSVAEGGRDVFALPLGVAVFAAFVTYLGAIGTWIYKSWEFLPYEMRRTANGRAISPGEAVGYLFVPFYNLYWIFVQTLGLCEAIDAALVQSGKAPAAPRNLALAASITQVIPYLNWLFGPVLWVVYMFMVDGAKARLLDAR